MTGATGSPRRSSSTPDSARLATPRPPIAAGRAVGQRFGYRGFGRFEQRCRVEFGARGRRPSMAWWRARTRPDRRPAVNTTALLVVVPTSRPTNSVPCMSLLDRRGLVELESDGYSCVSLEHCQGTAEGHLMPLARTADLVAAAYRAGSGVVAFNVITLEHAEAIVAGAERVEPARDPADQRERGEIPPRPIGADRRRDHGGRRGSRHPRFGPPRPRRGRGAPACQCRKRRQLSDVRRRQTRL